MIWKASWKRENVRTWCNIFHLNKCHYLSYFPLNRYKSQSHTAFTLWSARESRGYWWCLYSCCSQHFVVCTWRQRWTGNVPADQRGRGCHELTCLVSRFNVFWDDSAPLSSIKQIDGVSASSFLLYLTCIQFLRKAFQRLHLAFFSNSCINCDTLVAMTQDVTAVKISSS